MHTHTASRLHAAATVAPVQATPSTTTQAQAPSQPQGDGIGGAHPIRLSISERARTVTYVATAATLGTASETGTNGVPFGSYVDYILDDKVGVSGCSVRI